MSDSPITDALGYSFHDAALLRQALTHRSHGALHNERLEFLGDGVLNCVVAEELFRRFPQMSEGDLSRLRAGVVNRQSLCECAQNIALGEHMRLGEGEIKSGGARRPSILADTMEALIGAVFLDGGYAAARGAVVMVFADRLATVGGETPGKDPKTLLQELLQGQHLPLPQYSIIETHGAAHNQVFRVACVIPELGIHTEGEGASRRSAEQAAARRAYELGIHS
ncbi:MAG TPA: ribonuclease III [Burkholderiales bacterium]|nr:ribonuclease III [Burkholderiales bacterium]